MKTTEHEHHFDSHWQRNSFARVPVSKKLVAEEFLRPVLKDISSREDVYVLEVGCGDGVHSEVIKENGDLRGHSLFVGIDISLAALRMARSRSEERRRFICGDAVSSPFFNNRFDIAFAYGALAYTADPHQSFFELCRVVKPGGLVGIWMYPRVEGVGGWLFRLVRKICGIVGPFGARMIAHCIVPFMGLLPTNSRVSLRNASWHQCLEVVLVNLSPRQLYFPRYNDVLSWFKNQNMDIVFQNAQEPITIWGKKQ